MDNEILIKANERTLKIINEFVEKLKSTTSTNEKKEILAEACPTCKLFLEKTESNEYKYHVTSKNCKKHSDIVDVPDNIEDSYLTSIWSLLAQLNSRGLTGHEAIGAVNGYVAMYPEYEELIYSIIDKKTKTRASATLINKVFPNLIPVFKVALAEKFEEGRADFQNEDWYWSRKLDGVRCVVKLDPIKKVAMAYSREGNEFTTLGVLLQDVVAYGEEAGLSDITYFDGEACIMKGDVDDFKGIMKEIKRKDHTIESPKFLIFDVLTEEEFSSRSSKAILSERIDRLDVKKLEEQKSLKLLDQVKVKSLSHMLEMADLSADMGHEGIMIRKDAGYLGKKSYELMKVKKFHDAEYEVIGIESEVQNVSEGGKSFDELMMANVNVLHKGNVVGVGSGWSREQRREFHKDPTKILGKIITVQYQEESQCSKTGEYSLRFPTVKFIYEGERDV